MSALRIALLTYRGNPRCGGQGVYVRHLSRELVALGHHVEVIAGQPYPELDPGVTLTKLPSLDLFAEPNPFRRAKIRELKALPDWLEYAAMRRGGFGEPLAFSLRAAWYLRRRDFDVVHDNQSLGYGLLGTGLPVLATVHHPIAIDRELKLAAGREGVERWYGFVGMQHRVARRLPKILTVSEASRDSIREHMGVVAEVVPLAADTRIFKPRPEIAKVPGRIVTTASADEPLKGLEHLLAALDSLPEAELVVVGKRKPAGPRVRFVSGLSDTALAELIASAEVVCVPSLYEGFSLPAAEAMACGTALVTTSAGAIPEVVGDAAMIVPPADSDALAKELLRVLTDGDLRARLGAAGLARTATLSWEATARETVRHYRELTC
ncbi:Glycosyltransferase involved in cell wall bisynthesis [Amycolatopsis xylanica]|uniref:Glycosyltransferase involved in cell wall bisynthesis n=1 Tax=Amycolatopsis xylanica TaxID=589385 RepID=A0A1H3JCI4_9PSEU|nr:glycosyltransferase family 4 protein [Amycolatopsis xylanica]SDY37235.1 Glycosyltransferase involved in cell wall bisynthesis [Amycolatopsis xylanica]